MGKSEEISDKSRFLINSPADKGITFNQKAGLVIYLFGLAYFILTKSQL